jgi:hypothetical protein
VLFVLGVGLLEVPFHLLLGWIALSFDVVPQNSGQRGAVAMLARRAVAGHGRHAILMSRLCVPKHWLWRWTLVWCAMLIVMFSTSIAAVGIVHQTGWLFRLPGWIEMGGIGTQVKAVSNAKQIVLAARQYASAHDGKFPEICADMMPEIITDSRIFWASVDRNMPLEPLVYAGAGLRDTDHGNWPVVWSPRPSANGRRAVARLDGSAEIIREEKFQEMLASRREFFARREATAKTSR